MDVKAAATWVQSEKCFYSPALDHWRTDQWHIWPCLDEFPIRGENQALKALVHTLDLHGTHIFCIAGVVIGFLREKQDLGKILELGTPPLLVRLEKRRKAIFSSV